MTAWRAVWEVARRELVERSRSRALQVSLVLLLIVAVGGAIAAARVTGTNPTDDIGLVGTRSMVLQPAIRLQARAAGRRLRLHRLASPSAAARAVRNGSVEVALLDGSRILVKTSPTGPAVRVVEQAVAAQGVLDRLKTAGLTQAQALTALSPAALPVDVLAPHPANYDRNQALIVTGLLALFMALVFFGQAVAQGVTEEKSTRVVELLLTTLSPRQLLAGKILGIGLLGLVLLLVPGAAALAAGKLAGGVGLPSAAPEAVALILLWFVLGYAFYSVAFAAVGSLVSRQEDLNTALLPVNAVLIGAFYLAIIVAGTNPNGTIAQVAALLPPFSPMLVPARMVLGDMNMAEFAIAVVLEVAGILGMIVLAARAYERAILRVGAPIKLHRALAIRSPQATTGRPGDTASGITGRNQRRFNAADLALRVLAVGFVLGGVLIGFEHPLAIVLVAIGVLCLIVRLALSRRSRLPRRPHRPAH